MLATSHGPQGHNSQNRHHAATWRDDDSSILSTTFSGTVCWCPRRPWRLSIRRQGDELVIPCGQCPGCLELQKRWLANRLCKKYPPSNAPLWIAVIGEHLLNQARRSRLLHRKPALKLESGFFRLSLNRFAVLTRAPRAVKAALKEAGVDFSIHPVFFSRRRRAWRLLTLGIGVARSQWGENFNRFYARGLPPRERYRWEVQSAARGRGYDRRSSPRVWAGSGLVLVPPEAWKDDLLHQFGLKRLLLYLNRRGEAASDPRGEVKAKKSAALLDSSLPFLSREGYRTSEHSIVPVPPDIQAMIDRMAALARARGRGG